MRGFATPVPGLVLPDLKMPVMNGFKFQLPSLFEQQSMVILTTSLHEQDLARLYHLPIAEVLTKALTEAHLRDLPHRHFQ